MSGESDIIRNDFGYSYLRKNQIISVYNDEFVAREIFEGMRKQMNDFKEHESEIESAFKDLEEKRLEVKEDNNMVEVKDCKVEMDKDAYEQIKEELKEEKK